MHFLAALNALAIITGYVVIATLLMSIMAVLAVTNIGLVIGVAAILVSGHIYHRRKNQRSIT